MNLAQMIDPETRRIDPERAVSEPRSSGIYIAVHTHEATDRGSRIRADGDPSPGADELLAAMREAKRPLTLPEVMALDPSVKPGTAKKRLASLLSSGHATRCGTPKKYRYQPSTLG